MYLTYKYRLYPGRQQNESLDYLLWPVSYITPR